MKIRMRPLITTLLAGFISSSAFAAGTSDGYDTTLDHLTFGVQGQQVGRWTQGQLALSGGIQVGQSQAACNTTNAGTDLPPIYVPVGSGVFG